MKSNILKQALLSLTLILFLGISGYSQNAWINEFHYDNTGADVGEFIEVVVENPGSYTLSLFEVYLYNGNGGILYGTTYSLDAFAVGTTSGNFTFYYYDYPSNGLQNGSPDGFALAYNGTVISGQFLSYEGIFSATEGPASGTSSNDVGVIEDGTDPTGLSLQLSGNGTSYGNFTWQSPATETKGNLNNGQTFPGGGVGNPSNFAALAASTTQIDLSWTRNTNLDDVLLAWNSTNTFGTPSGTYTPGSSITGGGTVLYVGSDTTFNHTSLSSQTDYFYSAWSVDGTTTYSSGISANATTLAEEPSNYPASFTGTPGGLAIFLSWTDATGSQLPHAYLVKASNADTLGNPADGVPVADDVDLSDGYAVLNIDQGIESCSFYGLDTETQYFFKIFPYTNSGTNINYKTDGTPPSTNVSTRIIITSNDFETGTFGTWDTINVAGSAVVDNNWQVYTSGGGALGSINYAQINGFNQTFLCNDWLISPALNFDNYTSEAMSFLTNWSFGNLDNELMLKYSTDYSGDPSTATWTTLAFDKPATSYTWTGSGYVDLSSLSGTVYIAFHYLANATDPRRWRVDEIVLTGSGVANPDNFVTSGVSSSQIDLSWALNGNSNDVLIAYNTVNTFGAPTGSYTQGDPITGGGTVLYAGSGTSTSHSGLPASTQYYYRAWSYTGSFVYSGGVTDDATTFANEPSTHPSGFSAISALATRITVGWTDSGADNYLVKASAAGYGSIVPPTDGVAEPDSELVKNVAAGQQSVQFTSLDPLTPYYFKIYPYNGTGTGSNYKIDGTVPETTGTTTDLDIDLIISEIVDPLDNFNARYIELHNTGSEAIDFSNIPIYFGRQANGGSITSVILEGSVEIGETHVIGYSSTTFESTFGFVADQYSGSITGNGNDGYFLYYDGDATSGYLFDSYGVLDQDGSGQDWEYTDGHSVRKRGITSPNNAFTMDEWIFVGANADQMTPGAHAETVTWQGTSSADWNEKGTNWSGTNGYVPDASYDVTLPDVTNDPQVNEGSACNDLQIQTGAAITIKNGGSLIVVKQTP